MSDLSAVRAVNPFVALRELFPEARRFVWMPNGGNLGDALIATATVQGLDAHLIPWAPFAAVRAEIGHGDVLVYGGGGALTEDYQGAFDCVSLLHSFGLPVAVLPSTIRGNATFWERLAPTTVFCRELDSLAAMGAAPQHRVLLAHDLALGLRLDEAPFASVVEIRRQLVRTNRLVTTPLPAFRGDGERTLDRRDAIDVSAAWYPSMAIPAEARTGAALLLSWISPFAEVHTDRLHVGIACGLLGVEAQLFPDRNRKLAAVYEMSLRGRFPTLHWAG